MAGPGRSELRRSELLAALSLAVDVGMGQPMEQGLRTCLVAVRLGGAAGLDAGERQRAFQLALLRHVGCTAENHLFASLLGDEVAFRRAVARTDFSRPSALGPFLLRWVGAGQPPLARLAALGRLARHAREFVQSTEAICESAQLLAAGLGTIDAELARGLAQVYERWDGKGLPAGVAGQALAPAVRVVHLAEGAVIAFELGGEAAAAAVVAQRGGSVYDPALARVFGRSAPDLLAGLDSGTVWDAVLGAEPRPGGVLAPAEVTEGLRAMADFVDLKSPFTVGHSSGVGDLAAAAAGVLGLPAADADLVRRAGYVHDLGRVAVSAGVWAKPGPLTRGEREHVRLHPYYTERALARPPALAAVGAIAGLHHERLDGSGYHRGARGPALPPLARVLAAADAFHARREPRPHRPPLDDAEAAAAVRAEAKAGLLDGEAVEAVVAASGQRSRRPARPGGLTAREVEVLRLVARGRTIKEMAAELVVSPKTVDAHLQHAYTKIGVSTRAAATVFAMQHDLLDPVSGG